MTSENKYRNFLDNELPSLIAEGMTICFTDLDIDPEVSWVTFRDGLRKIKKKHKELYLEYEESDDETELPESEISKWRKENNQNTD